MREEALADVGPAPEAAPNPAGSPALAGCQIWIRYPSGRFLTYEFDRRQVYLGRGDGNDVRLAHPFISARHLMIETVGQRHQVTDLGSLEGTRVNGQALEPLVPHPLCDQDRIEVGPLEIAIETVFDATLVEEPEAMSSRPSPRWVTARRRALRGESRARTRFGGNDGESVEADHEDDVPATVSPFSLAPATRGSTVMTFHQPPRRPIDARWSILLQTVGVFVTFAALAVFVVLWFL